MLGRARLVFGLAVLLAGFILVMQFPVSGLVHARASAVAASSQLAKLKAENHVLSSQVRDLEKGSAIQQIAHEEYGLVDPGQRAVVVMPGGTTGGRVRGQGSTGSASPLGAQTIPKGDLVPSDAQLNPDPPSQGSQGGGSYWHRLLNRLEFWKASS